MHGKIFDIQRFCIHDGPGIRTTVFMKGCNLKCAWCHNPESQSKNSEMLFYEDKCTGCGQCAETAETDFFECPNGAKEICGKDVNVDYVAELVLQDTVFYKNSGGGVTFSGGECMLQIDFLFELLKRCKENGIHTAVDTAGNVPWEYFDRILKYTDLFLYDIKLFDSVKHKLYTGVDNKLILTNLKNLFEAKANVCIRIPIIVGVNDSIDNMRQIKSFLGAYKPLKIELLPYHKLGLHKYDALYMEKHEFAIPDEHIMTQLNTFWK